MPVLHVGPSSTYASIAEAMTQALPGDTIALEDGYSGETATVTESAMIVSGDASNRHHAAAGDGSGPHGPRRGTVMCDSISGPSTVANSSTGGTGNTSSGQRRGRAVNAGWARRRVRQLRADKVRDGDFTSNFTDAGGGDGQHHRRHSRAFPITTGALRHHHPVRA